MTPALPFRLVDAFTERPFVGNRAGVVLDAGSLPEAACLAIAREVNASETAFVGTRSPELHHVRFFTPALEVPLCGHATLAAFLVLAEEGRLRHANAAGAMHARMLCGAGEIAIEVVRDGGAVRVRQRQRPPTFRDAGLDPAAAAALHGLAPDALLADLPLQVVSTGLPLLLVPVLHAAALAGAEAAPGLADAQRRLGVAGSYLFTLDAPTGFRAETRLFADASGVAEDPATGTGAGALGAFFAHHGLASPTAGGSAHVRFLQGRSLGRRSEIDVEVSVADRSVGDVVVSGTGVVTIRGTIDAPA